MPEAEQIEITGRAERNVRSHGTFPLKAIPFFVRSSVKSRLISKTLGPPHIFFTHFSL